MSALTRYEAVLALRSGDRVPSEVFAFWGDYFKSNPTQAFSIGEATALLRAEWQSTSSDYPYHRDDYRQGILRMSKGKQKAVWLHVTSGLGFEKTENTPFYRPTENLYILARMAEFMGASMPRETAEATQSFLLSALACQPDRDVFTIPTDSACDILRKAVAQGKIGLNEVVEPVFDLLTATAQPPYGLLKEGTKALENLLPRHRFNEYEKTTPECRIGESLFARMTDAMAYGVGKPPSFALRERLLKVLSRMEHYNRLPMPPTRPYGEAPSGTEFPQP